MCTFKSLQPSLIKGISEIGVFEYMLDLILGPGRHKNLFKVIETLQD